MTDKFRVGIVGATVGRRGGQRPGAEPTRTFPP
jgi:hypothetical protein